jgi:DNA damage-inducible protein 1
MLKAHQACIDLEKNCLRIRGREVRFLAEHELPDKAKGLDELEDPEAPPSASGSTLGGAGSNTARPFPGAGSTLGGAPAASPSRTAALQGGSRHPEASISTLMGLGSTREQAISALDAVSFYISYRSEESHVEGAGERKS